MSRSRIYFLLFLALLVWVIVQFVARGQVPGCLPLGFLALFGAASISSWIRAKAAEPAEPPAAGK